MFKSRRVGTAIAAALALVASLLIVPGLVAAQNLPTPLITFGGTESFTVSEGDTTGRSYTVALGQAPDSDVTVTVTGQADTDLTLSGLSDGTLTFTTSNWHTSQTVTVTAAEDDDRVNDTVTLSHAVTSNGQTGQASQLTVTVTDDDQVGLVVAESLTVSEGDTTGSNYTISLLSDPFVDVTVTVTGQADTDLTLGGLSDTDTLTFTTSNWNTSQTVTVTAAEDDDDANDVVTLTHTAAGGDYANKTADLAVTVTDDDEEPLLYSRDANRDIRTGERSHDPRAVWSDGTTIWVSVDKVTQTTTGYTTSTTSTPKVLAFDLTEGDTYGNRVTSKDIEPGNARISGLWSDETTMWVVTTDGNKIKAYVLDGGARDSDKDISLDAGNAQPRGLWSDGTTIWTADNRRGKLYAYTLESGARNANSDKNLHAHNTRPGGLWSDDTTVWVTDRFDSYAYAYTLSTGERDTTKEFSTAALGHHSTYGVWADDTTIWVAELLTDTLAAYHATGNRAGGA